MFRRWSESWSPIVNATARLSLARPGPAGSSCWTSARLGATSRSSTTKQSTSQFVRKALRCHWYGSRAPTSVWEKTNLSSWRHRQIIASKIMKQVRRKLYCYVMWPDVSWLKKFLLKTTRKFFLRFYGIGSLGTSSRECNKTSTGTDSCEHLCCGRGYDTTRVTRVFQCKCKFHWCCEVRCERCEVTSDVHTCKTEKGKERKGRGRKGRGRKRRGRRRKPKEVLRTKRSVFVEEDFDLDRWMDGDPHESRAENNDETTWWPEQSKVSVINGRPRLNEEILKLYNEWRAIRQKTALKTKYAANPISSWWRNVLDYFKFWLQ